jgi:hypothetical protein
MKKTIITTAVLVFTLSGCVKQVPEYCPPPTTVSFDFVLSSGEDFGERVTAVNAGVFDAAGNYLYTARVGKSDLESHEGMELSLAPGDYRLVFWANMNGSTNVEGFDNEMEGRLTHSDAVFNANRVVVGQTDPLFYAPFGELPPGSSRTSSGLHDYYPLTIEPDQFENHVISFIHAYRILEIFLVGLEEDEFPMVEIGGLPEGLSYTGMTRLNGNVAQTRKTTRLFKDGQTYAMARLRAFRFDAPEDIEIVITDDDDNDAVSDPDGDEIYRIRLDEAIERFSFDFGQITIQLVFKFNNGDVEITMPGWDTDDIDFEFDFL